MPLVSFYTPENIRKTLVFSCSQGVEKVETSHMKWVNNIIAKVPIKFQNGIILAVSLLALSLQFQHKDKHHVQIFLTPSLNGLKILWKPLVDAHSTFYPLPSAVQKFRPSFLSNRNLSWQSRNKFVNYKCKYTIVCIRVSTPHPSFLPSPTLNLQTVHAPPF